MSLGRTEKWTEDVKLSLSQLNVDRKTFLDVSEDPVGRTGAGVWEVHVSMYGW